MRLRYLVEKVVIAAASLASALELLVNKICLAVDTKSCAVYLADNERCSDYLVAQVA